MIDEHSSLNLSFASALADPASYLPDPVAPNSGGSFERGGRMIYTVQYRVEIHEAQTPREAAQMVANGLATGQHFPMTFNVFGPDEAYVSTETITRIEEVALLEVPIAAPAATDEEPWPGNSVMAALEQLLAGDRGLDREQVRAYLIENEDRIWTQYLGPMADEIEGEIVGEISEEGE